MERFLAPLERLGEFGATLEHTLKAFFDHGMRPEATANALFIHPNTLRHRFRRYEATTGADLGATEDLIGIWWALQRRITTSS